MTYDIIVTQKRQTVLIIELEASFGSEVTSNCNLRNNQTVSINVICMNVIDTDTQNTHLNLNHTYYTIHVDNTLPCGLHVVFQNG